MLVYSSKNVRGTAGFEALCFEPEDEADCKAIDALLDTVKLMVQLKLVDGGAFDDSEKNPPEPAVE